MEIRITHADRELIDDVCKTAWTAVFQRLDVELDFTGDFAGEAAHAAETAVRALLERELAVEA